MAKQLKQIQQYELKVPGIGMNQTRHGTLVFRFTAKNILKLRDALALAAEKLTELAVLLIEQEREAEVAQLAPPPDPETIHQQRLGKARRIPQAGLDKQVEKSLERARSFSRRNAVVAASGEGKEIVAPPVKQRSTLVNVGAKPLGAGDIARRIIEKKEPDEPEGFTESVRDPNQEIELPDFKPSEQVQQTEQVKVIVSGGFEPDDGLLGEPPASIRE